MNLSHRYQCPLTLLRGTCLRALFSGLVLLSSAFARADLPTMEAPSRGEGSGLIDTIKNYAYDGGILLGLLIATLAFLGVAWHSLTVYADVQNQRKTWKDLGAVVGVGTLLVVVILWFLTKAATIL
ncbi:TIGR03745 family integrating conjugative element membrane protein [Pseudomonas sp. PS01300]|uniref:TIGR03745 family integrating conjugative element membrane protein n=1 Tax=Pseudomonas sp. PS01300 TaxID=2991436 RepID=UPI002499ED6F|nr:TIGR03745 family integrating conjugative element membrane protein [Pseudomonas sp. PS01300]